MKIIFATHNKHKIEEIRHLADKRFTFLSLQDIDLTGDIPEDYQTLEENALFKARFIFQKTGIPTFADDTGLEIAGLNNRPGVFSARYAGANKDDQANMDKVLKELKNTNDRSARFRTVIAFVWSKEKEKLFEGIVNGKIGLDKKGEQGFGYDPVFIPGGYNITFAEMPLDVKNSISHRSRAFKKFISFLNKEFLNDKA